MTPIPKKHMSKNGNMLLVANWESDVGYAWWLMEGFWITIAEHLEKRGIESFLIYPKVTKLPEAISDSNITVEEIKFTNSSWKDFFKLLKLIKLRNIKYIYLTDSPTHSWRYVFLRLWGINKIIVHEHTPGERTKPKGIKKSIKILIQHIPFYTADHFIGVTEFVHQRLIQVACIPSNKCSVAPNGIYPIDSNSADMNYAQEVFGIPENKTIVVTTGRATYYKGIDFFIECANEIINKKNLNDFHFLYCGDGPNLDNFKMLVKEYNLSPYFTFAGRRNDIRNILPSCHIGFHAAAGEVGYSLSILEYMSAGLITVVSDNPSTSLATKHKKTGYLFKRNDVSSAIDAIIESSANTYENEKIKAYAKKYVNEVLNIDNTHSSLRIIVDKALIH